MNEKGVRTGAVPGQGTPRRAGAAPDPENPAPTLAFVVFALHPGAPAAPIAPALVLAPAPYFLTVCLLVCDTALLAPHTTANRSGQAKDLTERARAELTVRKEPRLAIWPR